MEKTLFQELLHRKNLKTEFRLNFFLLSGYPTRDLGGKWTRVSLRDFLKGYKIFIKRKKKIIV
jgi:hypothetical protein